MSQADTKRTRAQNPVYRAFFTAVALVLLSACTSLTRNPVPVGVQAQASISGMPGIRAWAGEFSQQFHDDLIEAIRAGMPTDFPSNDETPTIAALALSGGGADGAFGAGFLYGWSRTGERPEFKLVTGISTGALIAPFAFAGPDFDEELRTVTTTLSNKDVFKRRNPLTVLSKDSLVHTTPLAHLIERSIDTEMLDRIAREHAKGRRLFVGTTDLDAQQLVVWNMGAIAASDHPRAPRLFREVLLASASIPVAFPPVYIEVEADGAVYDEMHVDGGVLTEFFLIGALIDVAEARREALAVGRSLPTIDIYVIRNGKLGPVPEQVPRKLSAIASRSMLTLIKAVAMGDLIRIERLAKASGAELHYVGIAEDFEERAQAFFDPVEMERLFELGRELAMSDHPWRDRVPITY